MEGNGKTMGMHRHIHGLHSFHGFHGFYGGAQREQNEKPDQFLPDALDGAKIIAELGCGAGFYCKYLQKYAEKLYCVDASGEALEEAKKQLSNSNVVFLNEDAAHTSIPSGSIDALLFANSFHDMDREQVYKEAKRILKPSGRVIIIDWEKKETEFGPPMSIRLSKEDYLEIFNDFKLEKEFTPGMHHYGLVLRRKQS